MPPVRPTAVLIAAMLVVALASGCAQEDTSLAGNVVDDTVTLSAPALAVPTVDIDAGFAPGGAGSPNPTAGTGASAGRSTLTTAAAVAGLGQYTRVATVTIESGDSVRAGDVVAVFETAALAADVSAAKAARATAKAQLPVIEDALDEVASGRSTLSSARAKAVTAIADAKAMRADLVAKRAELEAILDALPPSVPPTLPPGVPRPPDPAQIREAIAQIDAGLAKIDAGIAKAQGGLETIASNRGRLADAKRQLEDARDLARIGADLSALGVKVAQHRLDNATVRAPVDGTVVSAVDAGDALAPGATIAVIRPDSASRVTTWITPEQVAQLSRSNGSKTWGQLRFEVSGDWSDGRSYPGRLVRVGTRAQYPPTSFSTREVHLMRAVEVELEVDGATLPPGAPVDVTMR